MKKLISLCCLFTLAACTTPAAVKNIGTSYDAQKEARIRVYAQNQKPSTVWSGIDCASNSKGKKVSIGSSLGDAFGSLTGTVNSKSIGIAETDISKNAGQRNGILSRTFFREWTVEAGKPLNVQAAYIGLSNRLEKPTYTEIYYEGSCRSNIASFVPQAGHDYEIVGSRGKKCAVSVYEVASDGSLTPVKLSEAYYCAH